MDARVERYLQPDEAPVDRQDRHPWSIVDGVLSITVLAGLLVTGLLVWTLEFESQRRFLASVAAPAIVLVGTLWGLGLLAMVWRVRTSRYVITDQRVYKSYGRLRFTLLQTTYDKVTDLHVRQSLWGRWGGFGTVTLETAGTGIALEGIRDPFGFKQRVESARSAFITTLIGERPTPQDFAVQPEEETKDTLSPLAATAVRWEGRPAPASLAGPLVLPVLFIIPSILAGSLGAVEDTRSLLIPAGVLTLLLFMAANAFIRYRFTHYHVERRGVVVTSGWLTRRRVETTYEKITDVSVYQGLLGRILGFGNITINTAGSNQAPVVFHGVPDPEDVKRRIDEARA